MKVKAYKAVIIGYGMLSKEGWNVVTFQNV